LVGQLVAASLTGSFQINLPLWNGKTKKKQKKKKQTRNKTLTKKKKKKKNANKCLRIIYYFRSNSFVVGCPTSLMFTRDPPSYVRTPPGFRTHKSQTTH
jgi:hypothetical protein